MRLSLALIAGAVLMSSPIYKAKADYYDNVCAAECDRSAGEMQQHCLSFYGRDPSSEWCMIDADRNREACMQQCIVSDGQGASASLSLENRHKPKEVVAERALG